ncbi:glycoside hydrolase family 16 protein [Blastomonas sp. AAP53]|uniref:glycoside hydrolase family 16 protein n=1 Tax=Blastomonas sp. AAP53 TaxID=1248760 RepID=UPI00030C9D4C|nr:glycoside hydrolase family 16 protein [Blastomonas sp. AAP53]
MTSLFHLPLAVLAATTPAQAPLAASPAQGGWDLVWSDEFDGTALDPAKWKPELSCWGGGNAEQQCYTYRAENIRVEDGKLHLLAKKERFTGPDRPPEIASTPNPQTTQPYTSGKVRTRGLAAWRYGRVEFRAKVPRGQGTWPAVWMMPADDAYGGWPLSGEIDILEAANLGATCKDCTGDVGENRTSSALHFGDSPPRNTHIMQRVALPDDALPSDDFHVWTLEWAQGLMRFYLDGRMYWEVTPDKWFTTSEKARGNAVAPFDQPFYLMANLAIGGRMAEDNNDKGVATNVVPAGFEIDWVRVYQCKDDRATGLACMKRTEEN